MFFNNLVVGVFNTFNVPIITSLPFGMDGVLVTAFGYFYALMAIVPPLQVIWPAFIIYLSFKVLLFTLKQARVLR